MIGNYYKKAYEETLQKCPKWKQSAILEDIANKKNSGIVIDFIQNIVYLAESRFDTDLKLVKNCDINVKKTNTSKKTSKSKKTTLKK